MAIPDYQTLMLPLLRSVSDGEERHIRDVTVALADEFSLSDEERKERLPSGQQTVISNRVGWAKSYLKNAGLVEQVKRGVARITDEGRRVLREEGLERIDAKWLERYPSYMEFRNQRRKPSVSDEPEAVEETQTPEELLEDSFETLQDALADEVLDQIKGCSPQFFEQLVVELLAPNGIMRNWC